MEKLVELLLEHASKNGYGATFVPIAFIAIIILFVGSILGWFAGRRKTVAETEKLSAETLVKYSELKAKVDQKRAALLEQVKQFDLFLLDLQTAVKKNRTRGLRKLREEICWANSKEYLPALIDYLEDCSSFLQEHLRFERAIGAIVPAIQTQINFLNLVNHEKLFERIKHSAPYRLSRNEVDALFRGLYRCVSWRHFGHRARLRGMRRQLNESVS